LALLIRYQADHSLDFRASTITEKTDNSQHL